MQLMPNALELIVKDLQRKRAHAIKGLWKGLHSFPGTIPWWHFLVHHIEGKRIHTHIRTIE